MEKEKEEAFQKIEEIYSDDLECKIDAYILLFGTVNLEKLLNNIFKDRQIEPIKISSPSHSSISRMKHPIKRK